MKTAMKILPVLIVTAFLIGCPGGSVKASSEKEESSPEKEEAFSTISDAWSVLRGRGTGTSKLWGVILDNPNDWYEGDTAPKADENGYHFIWSYDVFTVSIYNVSDGTPIVEVGSALRKDDNDVSRVNRVDFEKNGEELAMVIIHKASDDSSEETWYKFLQMRKIGDDKVKLRTGTVSRVGGRSDLSDQAVTLKLISQEGKGIYRLEGETSKTLKEGVWEVNPKTPSEWYSVAAEPGSSGSHYFTWKFVDDDEIKIINVAKSDKPSVTTGIDLRYATEELTGVFNLEIKNPNGAVVYDLLLNHLSDDIVIFSGNIVRTDGSTLFNEHVILRK